MMTCAIFQKRREGRRVTNCGNCNAVKVRTTGDLSRKWGPGVNEIRIDSPDGWFRVMYVAKFEEAIYVLHSFQKSTRKTARNDVEIARTRYRAVVSERKASK